VVSGTLTARVTSAKDNDIYAWQDASGMYRVKFDADRDDKRQGMESMPVRLPNLTVVTSTASTSR
jgi:type VI secretion system secreted protein VgrG